MKAEGMFQKLDPLKVSNRYHLGDDIANIPNFPGRSKLGKLKYQTKLLKSVSLTELEAF